MISLGGSRLLNPSSPLALQPSSPPALQNSIPPYLQTSRRISAKSRTSGCPLKAEKTGLLHPCSGRPAS